MKKVLLFALMLIGLTFVSCKKENYKPTIFKYESESYFDSEIINISKSDFDGTVKNFRIEVWYQVQSVWYLMPEVIGTGGANVSVEDGNVKVVLNVSPSENKIPIKIILTR